MLREWPDAAELVVPALELAQALTRITAPATSSGIVWVLPALAIRLTLRSVLFDIAIPFRMKVMNYCLLLGAPAM
jgi:hypothetical protein